MFRFNLIGVVENTSYTIQKDVVWSGRFKLRLSSSVFKQNIGISVVIMDLLTSKHWWCGWWIQPALVCGAEYFCCVWLLMIDMGHPLNYIEVVRWRLLPLRLEFSILHSSCHFSKSNNRQFETLKHRTETGIQ